MISLVLGGEKSGKSDHALTILADCPGPRIFVATGKALDDAFRRQIDRHRRERDPGLPVAEAGPDLAGLLEELGGRYQAILVDSLDFWLFGCGDEAPRQMARLLGLLDSWRESRLVLVSAEIGLGPVAATRQTRVFVRQLGELNRAVAARATQAHLLVAGLALRLK